MNSDDTLLVKRITELANRAYNGSCYTSGDFLSTAEQELLYRTMKAMPHIPWSAEGGAEQCERRMPFFGSEELCGYVRQPPIACVRVSPKNARFSDELSHRDFLGAIMSLGIERAAVGDIFIREKCGYVFCKESIAQYIADSLDSVKHTSVVCTVEEEAPPELAVQLCEARVNVPSERVDAVAAAVWGMSRSKCAAYFEAERVAVNSRLCTNTSYTLKPEDVVSVRGLGRFIYRGTERTTKKERLFVRIDKYI